MHHYKDMRLSLKHTHSVERSIGRMEGKMDAIQESLHHIQTQFSKADQRLRKLESLADKWKGYGSCALGASTLLGAIINTLISWIFK